MAARGGARGSRPERRAAGRAQRRRVVRAVARRRTRRSRRPSLGPGVGRGPWGMGPQGLPLVKPPYGRITAYNMNTGDIVWQVANGDTYDWIKTHPALKGVNIPKNGPRG